MSAFDVSSSRLPTPDLPLRKVVITGMGCVSPLGMNCPDMVVALRQGRDTAFPVTLFETEGYRCRKACQLPDTGVADAVFIVKKSQSWHRSARMLLVAINEARTQNPRFTPQAAIFGTTSGGMSFGEAFYRNIMKGLPPRLFRKSIRAYLPYQSIIDAIRIFRWHLAPQVISNACASGTNAIGEAFRLIAHGNAEQVMCGGYDALSQLVFAGFDCLQAASPDTCRPFDKNRNGLHLGEGAAVLFLESVESARKQNSPILGEILGYGAATDNFHLTQPNPSGAGPKASMLAALQSSKLSPDAIDYINAHGTGTVFNDASEALAIQAVCPHAPVSSTKSMMGHSLGAAGAIEAIICLLALQNQFLPPNIHFKEQDPGFHLNLVMNHSNCTRLQTALSNSFGFGGANASLLMGRTNCGLSEIG